jgi:hypothetical protein
MGIIQSLFKFSKRDSTIAKLPQVEDHLSKLSYSDCLSQEQSPLFSTIPPELRNQIFGLALAEQNGSFAIPTHKHYYRPDYTHHRIIDTALLRTCRRVYMETRDIPQQNVTCRFWLGHVERAAPMRKHRISLQSGVDNSSNQNLTSN